MSRYSQIIARAENNYDTKSEINYEAIDFLKDGTKVICKIINQKGKSITRFFMILPGSERRKQVPTEAAKALLNKG